jgi:tetratricopeptide (TPR) repeat protein
VWSLVLILAAAYNIAPVAAPISVDPEPLLAYAATQHFPPIDDDVTTSRHARRLAQVTFVLARDPAPAANCARTLGAKRFAANFDDLGGAYMELDDNAKALDAFTKAIDCDPRAGFLHAERSLALLNLHRYDEARAEAQRQIAQGRNNFSVESILAQLDFIQERWTEAITHSRAAAVEAPDDEQSTYWQCFLWLAQRQMGTAEPVLAAHRLASYWPRPILDSLQGKSTETDLVNAVKAEADPRRRHEILTEALFYTGQRYLATQHSDEARRYFEATVSQNVHNFIEHQLAVAELEQFHHP